MRTLEVEDGENPGMYLVIGQDSESRFDTWLCLVLVGDPDISGDEQSGSIARHGGDWLRDWSEPWK